MSEVFEVYQKLVRSLRAKIVKLVLFSCRKKVEVNVGGLGQVQGYKAEGGWQDTLPAVTSPAGRL